MRPSDKNKDHILIGIVSGLAFPVVAYAILLVIYGLLDDAGIVSNLNLSLSFRERTLALIAICFNLILLNVFNKRYLLNSMRGVVFPTLAFIIFWIFYYNVFSF